jgi:hypothetical protein
VPRHQLDDAGCRRHGRGKQETIPVDAELDAGGDGFL